MTVSALSNYSVQKFILFNIIIIFSSLYIAYQVKLYSLRRDNEKPIDFVDWINQGKVSFSGLAISLLFGVVFGFLDNLFLWIGIDNMMDVIPGGTLSKGAWGNTYSDFIGATVGASIASIGKSLIDVDESPPIWINAVAMPIGCILGMVVGRSITRKN